MVNSTVNKDYIVLGENICNAIDRQGVDIKIFFQRKRKHSNRKRVKNMNRQFRDREQGFIADICIFLTWNKFKC